MNEVSLVIFTCTGREHLLQKTYTSFLAQCSYKFSKVILAIDGSVNPAILAYVNPDMVIYGYHRKGYVTSIKNALINIDTPFFFWLEDDWEFHANVDVPYFVGQLTEHPDWVQIFYSKNGPLPHQLKTHFIHDNLYQYVDGFSANPCFNRTQFLKKGFNELVHAEKGNTLGADGFENFLTAYFKSKQIKSIIHDPVNHTII